MIDGPGCAPDSSCEPQTLSQSEAGIAQYWPSRGQYWPIRGKQTPPLTGSRQQHVWLRHQAGGWGQWSDPDGAFNIFDAFKSRSLPDNTTIIIPDAALSKTLLIHFLFSRCIKYRLTIVYSALSRITPPNINLRIFFISACIIISFLKQFMQKNLHPSAPRYLPRSLEILRIHPASALCMGPLLCEYNPESHDWMDIRLMTGWMSELPVWCDQSW